MHTAFQRVCAWSGLATLVLFFAAFVVADFVPPMSPALSAAEVAQHYRQHTNGVRIGACLMFVSGAFYAAYSAAISGQMRRIRQVSPTAIYAQLAGGSFACLTFMVPAMLFFVTAFRPERDPTQTQLLNDMSWIFLVIAWPPFAAQQLAFSYSILAERGAGPVFPRWLGYLNIWVVLGFTPATLLPFFKTGPFAWNGLLVFWVPATVFTIQFIANTAMLLRSIAAESRPEPESSGQDPAENRRSASRIWSSDQASSSSAPVPASSSKPTRTL